MTRYLWRLLKLAPIYSCVLLTGAWFPPNAHGQCVTCPVGIVSWWPGESNAVDLVGGISGTFAGTPNFAAGEVGAGFVLDGSSGGVQLGPCTNLHFQDFTIEAWIQRASTNSVTISGSFGLGFIFGFGNGGYGFYLDSSGSLALTKVGFNNVTLGSGITDLNFHHVAVTKAGTSVTFFIDGVAYSLPAYDPGFVFNTSAAIGAGGDSLNYSFWGGIDELAIYNRALDLGEIQVIYTAGKSGKCPGPFAPNITHFPSNQVVIVGSTAQFSASAVGTQPFSYQWYFNGVPLPNNTNSFLVLTNVGFSQAGSYSIEITNLAGNVTSSASLTVNPLPSCTIAPSGLVSWWRGEGNGWDQAGGNNGIIGGDTAFGVGEVNQGFVFDGLGGGVLIGNPSNLQLQDFTIEAWVKLAQGVPSRSPNLFGYIFGYDSGGYGLYLDNLGRPTLTKAGFSNVSVPPGAAITDTNFHHVAVAKVGTSVTFYIDGVVYSAPAYDPGFIFSTSATIGALGSSLQEGFWGTIDELAIYNRALDATEVQAIFQASVIGKCDTPYMPFILSGPTNETVYASGSATFSCLPGGTPPFTYQWTFNGAPITGATNASLSLGNLQLGQSGSYSLQVQNAAGSITSNIAVLTVRPLPPCAAAPAGLVSWWRAESNAWDEVSGNNGTLLGNTTFRAGKVGKAFFFDGQGDGVQIGNPVDLQLQDFTIEAWVQRASASAVTQDGNTFGLGFVFSYAGGGYGLYLDAAGHPTLTKFGVNNIAVNATISDTNLHHLAVTKDSTNVAFYIDGIQYAAPPYNPGFTFTTGAAIGMGGSSRNYSFWGWIDELAIYSRALSGAEIQNIYLADLVGKCLISIPPSIIVSPTNQTVAATSNAVLSVLAGGTPPLSYQWFFNGTPIPWATNNPSILTNLQFSQFGDYSVAVTNALGSATSSSGHLLVSFPFVLVTAPSTNIGGGVSFSLPITMLANGNENALGFSLGFDPSKLSFSSAALGSGAPNGSFIVNKSLVGSGKLGISIALPQGATFGFGTQEVARVSFKSTISSIPVATPLIFGDTPTPRQLWDTQLLPLPFSFSNSTISVSAVTSFEADVFPRPNGDRSITLSDWLQIGRYVVRLDYPTNATEFQRADCAPSLTAGDGAISVADWVQAGRYSAGLDGPAALGGPTNEAVWSGGAGPSSLRLVGAVSQAVSLSQTVSVNITLAAQGTENALAFSCGFNPSLMSFENAQLGIDSSGVTFFENTNMAALGMLGFALAKNPGETFAQGSNQVLVLRFIAVARVQGNVALTFTDQPVLREVSDASANSLPVSFVNVTGNVGLVLNINNAGGVISLSWPGWATNFGLQQASGVSQVAAIWTNVPITPTALAGRLQVTLPITNTSMLYRLHSP